MQKREYIKSIGVIIGISLLFTGCAEYKLSVPTTPYKIELGSTLSTDANDYMDYFKIPEDKQKEIIDNINLGVSSIDTSKVGEYRASISYGKTTYLFTADVVDTTAPIATVKSGLSYTNGTVVNAADVVESVTDLAEYNVKFVVDGKEADTVTLSTDGTNTLTVKVTDASGNSNTYTVDVNVYTPDTVAPAINGVKNLSTTVGTEISLTDGITVADDMDGDLTASLIVSGGVDFNTAGDYNITYTATDKSGNASSVPAVVTVAEVKKVTTTASATTSKKKSTTSSTKSASTTSETASTGTASSGSASVASGSSESAAVSSSSTTSTPSADTSTQASSTPTSSTPASSSTSGTTSSTPTTGGTSTTPAVVDGYTYDASKGGYFSTTPVPITNPDGTTSYVMPGSDQIPSLN